MSNVVSLFKARELKKVQAKVDLLAERMKVLQEYYDMLNIESMMLLNQYVYGVQLLQEELSEEELKEILYPPNKQLEFDFVYEGTNRVSD
jgi:uncharacterized protein YaaN involved in tellurite resistance